ncbi:sensor histidine kinase [Haloferula sp.]|uniref:sensor histidine kinase n=1 Tax=Haloferula sp. TaxID=2497595 RepID=UPI00329ADF4F
MEVRTIGLATVISLVIAGVTPCLGAVPQWVEDLTVWARPELREFDRRIAEIDDELAELPAPAGASSGSRRGFRTGGNRENQDNWVELTLPEPSVIDHVVLVPVLAKGAAGNIPGYGFPKRFHLTFEDEDGDTDTLFDATADDFPNPGLFPVSFECPPGVRIRKIRLNATESSERDGSHVLALAELMALAGNLNLALGDEVTVTSSSSRELWPSWSRANLTDMETSLGLPVLPSGENVMSGWQSEATSDRDKLIRVTVDLGETHQLHDLRITPARSDRMAASPQYGFPARFLIEGANREDFSDRWTIHDQSQKNFPPPGQNVLQFDPQEIPTRYLRVTSLRLRLRAEDFVFALDEIQAYTKEENVALGAKVIAEESIENSQWGRKALTDGHAGGGDFIELPDWIRGLEQRRQLEEERAGISSRRSRFLDQSEKALVFGSACATCGIAAFAGLYVWRSKRQRKIDRERHRERLARDLHDELGSNLGSIALISSFALEAESNPNQMRTDLAEIEVVARESADSMRDMVELLGGRQGGATSDWLVVMTGLAERLLRGVELDCQLPVSPLVLEPDLETRREIYLFCKELLYNAARHANPQNVRFHLMPSDEGLRIEIEDDGCGFNPKTVSQGHGLGNLRERAAGLNGTMKLESSEGGPTFIRLDVPRGKRWRKPRDREPSK